MKDYANQHLNYPNADLKPTKKKNPAARLRPNDTNETSQDSGHEIKSQDTVIITFYLTERYLTYIITSKRVEPTVLLHKYRHRRRYRSMYV